MILEGAMQVGLGEVAGVACFGEEAQIRESQPAGPGCFGGEDWGAPGAEPGGVGEGPQEDSAQNGKQGQGAM